MKYFAPLKNTLTTQNLAFFSYWYRKKRLQMHFYQVQCHNVVYTTRRWRAVVSLLHSQKIIALQNLLKVSPEKSQILSCDTVLLGERLVYHGKVLITNSLRMT
jgi:hypothetical protein